MRKQRPLWEPKYRIEAAFRRRLLSIVRNCILKQVRRAGNLDDMIQILQKVSESEEYKAVSGRGHEDGHRPFFGSGTYLETGSSREYEKQGCI